MSPASLVTLACASACVGHALAAVRARRDRASALDVAALAATLALALALDGRWTSTAAAALRFGGVALAAHALAARREGAPRRRDVALRALGAAGVAMVPGSFVAHAGELTSLGLVAAGLALAAAAGARWCAAPLALGVAGFALMGAREGAAASWCLAAGACASACACAWRAGAPSAAEQLEDGRLAALGRMAQALIHEVANPLNFIVGGVQEVDRRVPPLRAAVDALRPDAPPDAELLARIAQGMSSTARALELIRGGSERIRAVVDNLRQYLRTGQLTWETVDVAERVRGTARLMEPMLAQRGVTLTLALDALPPVRGRGTELSQVFLNLMLNSHDAVADGGHLTVRGARRGDVVELRFEDDGPGVPKDLRRRIFEPFFTTREARGGSGLGLSVSHEIARQHGGSLALVDSPRGACFVLTLPLREG